MTNQNLINEIKQLGLSEYEAKCYLALFERESLSVGEISKLTGIARPNAYEAMEKLLMKGLSVSIPGRIKKFTAAAPKLLRDKALDDFDNSLELELNELEQKKRDILERKENIYNELDAVINHLDTLFRANCANGDPLEYMEVIKNPAQVHHRVLELLGNSQKEMIGFTKPPYAFASQSAKRTRANFNEQIKCLNEAVQRGLVMRNIYELPEDKGALATWYNKVCEGHNPAVEDRAITRLPLKMTVFDRRFVIYQLEDPIERKPSLTSLITEHPALAEGFVAMFEYYWEKANDYVVIDGQRHSLKEAKKIES
jgi:sugar-specific transcriptional regulator TrmB